MVRPLFAAALAIALNWSAQVPSAHAADELPDEQMAPFQFSGLINADNVYVRSYATENDYPVIKLSKGDTVIVVGNRSDWLKILPPEGAYCLVGKAWVEARGDASVGRVRDEAGSPNVRIGSNVVASYGKIVTQIKAGDDVKILGQQDEYFKIAPPAGAFVYVHKRFVDLVRRVEVVNDKGRHIVKQPGGAEVGSTPPKAPDAVVPPTSNDPKLVDATAPATQPTATVVADNTPSSTPATQPAVAAVVDPSFEQLEARFNAATKQPLAQQPIDELIAGYTKVTAAKTLPEPMLRVAEFRLKGLALRRDAVENLRAGEASRKAREAAQLPLVEEGREISQRIAANESKRYAAVGTLRASALPANGRTLYRLTDPATGRTLIYVNDIGTDAAAKEGTFVGIRGTVTDDAARQIKLITPQAIEAVDPADLTRGTVTSGMVPPSLSTTSVAAQ